jgi:peptide/nickel transport system permease protein
VSGAVVPVPTDITPAALRRRFGMHVILLQFMRRKPLGACGALILITLGLLAIFGQRLAPYDPAQSVALRLQGPSTKFYFGTDWLGRDIFSRMLVGARTSFFTAALAIAVASFGGLALGGISGYFRGRIDLIVQRLVDAMLAIPLLVFAIAVVSVFGPHVWQGLSLTAAVAIGIALIPGNARVMRGAVLSVVVQPYIEAARAVGVGHTRLLWRHVLPNVLAPLIVLASIQLGAAVLIEASLSFLGLGVPPPTPTWGQMLSGEARLHMQRHPHIVLFPGLTISLFVIGINFLGDAMRDVLDPRLRGR